MSLLLLLAALIGAAAIGRALRLHFGLRLRRSTLALTGSLVATVGILLGVTDSPLAWAAIPVLVALATFDADYEPECPWWAMRRWTPKRA